MVRVKAFLLALYVICDSGLRGENPTDCPNAKTAVGNIRKRRHLAFPDGSNFVMTISLVKGFLTHVPSGWNTAIEIDVFFPLPDGNFTAAHTRRKLHHRQKRDYWERIENALDYHNMNGRSCILRSICEAREHLAPPGVSLVHDLLRAVFSAPVHEEDFKAAFSHRYDEFRNPDFCDQPYDCPISLLNFVLSLNKQSY